MRFVEIVATSSAVAATSSRTAKAEALASLLRRTPPAEVTATVGFLVGEPRQGRVGVGMRTLLGATADLAPAPEPSLEVDEVDATITALAELVGPGSGNARTALLVELFSRATAPEAKFLVGLLGGDLRQGALAGVMADAVARAADIPPAAVRRAVMLGGRIDEAAAIALGQGRAGLDTLGLEVGRPIQPMLASTAASPSEAIEVIGEASVEWKLDGIRVQVHRKGDQVSVFTRNLNDITARLPELVALVRALPVDDVVLDGEALVLGPGGRPQPFQDTAARVGADGPRSEAVLPHFFDIVHVDGRDLLDEPLWRRREELERVAGPHRIPGIVTVDPAEAEAVLADALAAGHEGVVVKATDSPYQAGRRGKAWRKVKPVHTLDLVVLAAEWGYGRRTGWLSNLHLGARADDGEGFVMVGKTFKGLTDDLLRWQTERFLGLAERHEPWNGDRTGVVWLRPEQVVEIALDGAQRSTRYPGGVALRFARVVRYREDKDAADVDRLAAVRALLAPPA